jgi:hypothetical protein
MREKKQDVDLDLTATDEMANRYRAGARIVPLTRDAVHSEPSGLPLGMHDSDKSPVDPIGDRQRLL